MTNENTKRFIAYIHKGLLISAGIVLLSACAPEIGSKEWCDNLEEKPKGDWSANEATDYAKHCLFKSRDDN